MGELQRCQYSLVCPKCLYNNAVRTGIAVLRGPIFVSFGHKAKELCIYGRGRCLDIQKGSAAYDERRRPLAR